MRDRAYLASRYPGTPSAYEDEQWYKRVTLKLSVLTQIISTLNARQGGDMILVVQAET